MRSENVLISELSSELDIKSVKFLSSSPNVVI